MTSGKAATVLCSLLAFCAVQTWAQAVEGRWKQLSDAAEDSTPLPPAANTISYEEALQQWKTVSDVSHWIKENFRYDMERARLLAENNPSREKTAIFSPAELYQKRKGVCIDLSRFAVETIQAIDTTKRVQYLMIEFDPISINGSIIKKHWMAILQDPAGYYVLADSKRPGYVAGPYANVDDFIREYQAFRERRIVSWKVLRSYQKKKKTERTKSPS